MVHSILPMRIALPNMEKSRNSSVEQPDGEVWLRTLVHNASLAADKKALIAVYRLSDGEYLADKSILKLERRQY